MKQLADLFNQGGAVMWLIAGISVAAWVLAIKSWRTAKFMLSDLTQVKDFIYDVKGKNFSAGADGKMKSIFPLLNWITGEISANKVVDTIRRKENKLIIENELSGLERSLGLLASLAGVLPLLGLLGTVLGMLVTFGVIQRHGTGEPALMAEGIRQALLTTQAGLLAALPVLFFHHIVSSRLKEIDVELNLVFHKLEAIFKNNGNSRKS